MIQVAGCTCNSTQRAADDRSLQRAVGVPKSQPRSLRCSKKCDTVAPIRQRELFVSVGVRLHERAICCVEAFVPQFRLGAVALDDRLRGRCRGLARLKGIRVLRGLGCLGLICRYASSDTDKHRGHTTDKRERSGSCRHFGASCSYCQIANASRYTERLHARGGPSPLASAAHSPRQLPPANPVCQLRQLPECSACAHAAGSRRARHNP